MYFMSNLLFTLLLASTCPKAKVVNLTPIWTSQDQENLDFAKTRCGHFYPNSPCLKKFIKKKTRTYSIICAGGE